MPPTRALVGPLTSAPEIWYDRPRATVRRPSGGFLKSICDLLTSPVSSAASLVQAEGFFSRDLAGADPELATGIAQELHRQQSQIELIASENIVSRAVLEAQGSVLTNKYAEGYPRPRYFRG